jgi:hypothetical protein
VVGPTLVKGTWILALVAVLPALVSQVAAAAPGYPVEDPPGAQIVVGYDARTNLLTFSSETTSTTKSEATADPSDPTAAVEYVEIASGVVEGPNGQINHGQVMKQLHELTEGNNSGCFTSAVAKSDLGKEDRSINSDGSDVTLIDTDCTTTDLLDDKPSANGSETASANQSKDHGKSSEDDDKDKDKDK